MRFAPAAFTLVLMVGLLAACASAPGGGATEKRINSISEIQGVWKGQLNNGNKLELRVKADGSWTNTVENMGYFEGTASSSNGIVRARSATTKRDYVWQVYEAKGAGAPKRTMTWTTGGRQIATVEFVGAR